MNDNNSFLSRFMNQIDKTCLSKLSKTNSFMTALNIDIYYNRKQGLNASVVLNKDNSLLKRFYEELICFWIFHRLVLNLESQILFDSDIKDDINGPKYVSHCCSKYKFHLCDKTNIVIKWIGLTTRYLLIIQVIGTNQFLFIHFIVT